MGLTARVPTRSKGRRRGWTVRAGRACIVLLLALGTAVPTAAQEARGPSRVERTGLDREALAAQAGLHAQEELLRGSERVHVLTNADDFILGRESLAWLRATAGERLTVFPGGGHLGNLHVEAVRDRVFEALDGPRSRLGAAETAP